MFYNIIISFICFIVTFKNILALVFPLSYDWIIILHLKIKPEQSLCNMWNNMAFFCWISLIKLVRWLGWFTSFTYRRASLPLLSFLCLSNWLRLAISTCPPYSLSAATGAQHGEVADGSSLGRVYVCVRARAGRRFVCECMHSNVTGLCNWNGNEPISSVVCLSTLRTLHSSSAPKFTLSVCDSVCDCLSLYQCACVFLCICDDIKGPLSFQALRDQGMGWKCNQLVINITYLSLAQPLRNMHTHTFGPALHPLDFPGFVFVTHSSLGQLWFNNDM